MNIETRDKFEVRDDLIPSNEQFFDPFLIVNDIWNDFLFVTEVKNLMFVP